MFRSLPKHCSIALWHPPVDGQQCDDGDKPIRYAALHESNAKLLFSAAVHSLAFMQMLLKKKLHFVANATDETSVPMLCLPAPQNSM